MGTLMDPEKVKEFFRFARERENIRIKKERGDPWPWTEDPVLQTHYFCNIFREDDKTTRWFRENVRDPLAREDRAFISTIAFRWFNSIHTGERVKHLLLDGWDSREAIKILENVEGPIFGGAYIIKSPNGMTKLRGICQCIDNFVKDEKKLIAEFNELEFDLTLQGMHKILMRYPFMGPFMAYEVVTDLCHTNFLEDAGDVYSWASAGPGCARGLQWLTDQQYNYNSEEGQRFMILEMRELLEIASGDQWWGMGSTGRNSWTMREVEHTLCEYDKWKRGHAGLRLKRIYNPTKLKKQK